MAQALTVNDPVFGNLIYNNGWAGSFADPHFATWGRTIIDRYLRESNEEPPRRMNDEELEEKLGQLYSVLRPAVSDDSELSKLMDAARNLPNRAQYDGSLDFDRLLKIGRFKVVVCNRSNEPPTAAQQEAWQQFRDRAQEMYNQVSERLFAAYQEQRPERLRWWAKIYGDSADHVLPEVSSASEIHRLMLPTEFRVYPDCSGKATITMVIDALWTGIEDIHVKLRDGAIVSIANQPSGGIFAETRAEKRIQSPVFGQLEWRMHDWCGTFHCFELRGFDEASELRHRFLTEELIRSQPRRQMPPWEAITGDFELCVEGGKDTGPTAAQEAAYRDFIRNLPQNAWLTLAVILNWYQQIRPNWVEQMTTEDAAQQEAIMPVIEAPEGLLDIIQLQTLTVCEKPDDDRPPAIVLSFHWFDEHGIGVRWRGGQVEEVGTWDDMDS